MSAAMDEFRSMTAQNATPRLSQPEDRERKSSDSSDSANSSVASSRSTRSTPRSTSASSNQPSNVYQLPTGTIFEGNTGPKGVIADAKSFDRARKRTFRRTLFAISNGISSSVLSAGHYAADSMRGDGSRRGSREKSDSEGESGEDEFIKTWRQNRMAELQNGSDVRTRRLSPSKRRWGNVKTVDAVGYLDAIEKVADDTIVVVMIHDEQSTVSSIVEDCLANLARKHEFTHFVKLSYLEAEMDPVSIPAILAYKGGELIANLVNVVDEIPAGRDMSASSLESILRTHKVL